MTKKNFKKLAIVVSNFNKEITDGLLKGAMRSLTRHGIKESKINVIRCPGAFEIPFTAKRACKSGNFSAVICLGAIVKGETAHFEYISAEVSRGIMKLSLQYDIPVTFGVLTCFTVEQAIARSSNSSDNKGTEAAEAALFMLAQKI